MRLQPGRAFLAGVAGAAVVTLIELLARGAGIPANLEMLLGTMSGGTPGALRWLAGLVLHLTGGGLLGIGYAVVFEYWRRAGWLPGLALGVPQALVFGAALGLLPRIHPLVPDVLAAPGRFMAAFGVPGVVLHLTINLGFGALIGVMYEAAMEDRQQRVVEPVIEPREEPYRRAG
jgi:hypothetical protein